MGFNSGFKGLSFTCHSRLVILTRRSDDQIKEDEVAVPAASMREKSF